MGVEIKRDSSTLPWDPSDMLLTLMISRIFLESVKTDVTMCYLKLPVMLAGPKIDRFPTSCFDTKFKWSCHCHHVERRCQRPDCC